MTENETITKAEVSRARYAARLKRLARDKEDRLAEKLKKASQRVPKEKLQDEVLAAIQRAKANRKNK